MHATKGTLITRCRYFNLPDLRVADTQIVSCDAEAAYQFGVDDPRLLVNRYMSDFQSPGWRQMGHQRYLDRKLNRPLSQDYIVQIHRPDGEAVGQRREFGGWLAGGMAPGEDWYLTYVEQVRELDHGPTIRELSAFEQEQARIYNGDCTVRDLRTLIDSCAFPVAIQATFLDIIKECQELSSGWFKDRYFSPLDLALSDDVTVCWLGKKHAQTTPVVRARFTCPVCGWRWYGRAREQAQCTAAACRHFVKKYW